MNAKEEYKKIAVIGAGPAGLFFRRQVEILNRTLPPEKRVQTTLFDKGAPDSKCHTYTDPNNPKRKADEGAVYITPTKAYGSVIEVICEKNIGLIEASPIQIQSMDIYRHFQSLSWLGKVLFVPRLINELYRYNASVRCYQHFRDTLQELPPEYLMPFSQFAEIHNLVLISKVGRPITTGFGYGLLEEYPTHSFMEYLEQGIMPSVLAKIFFPTVAEFREGYQHLITEMMKDYSVKTHTTITKIDRSKNGVTIYYKSKAGQQQISHYDAVVFAIPPNQWGSLGITPTALEQRCMDQMTSKRYPVAVCEIEGLPAKTWFVPEANEKSGLGHLALLTTSDTSTNGKLLFTAYINLSQHDITYSLDEGAPGREQLIQDIMAIPGVKSVKILRTTLWDYSPFLPWSLRLEIAKQQLSGATPNTFYTGACVLEGYESVGGVATASVALANKYLFPQKKPTTLFPWLTTIERIYDFMSSIKNPDDSNVKPTASPLLIKKQLGPEVHLKSNKIHPTHGLRHRIFSKPEPSKPVLENPLATRINRAHLFGAPVIYRGIGSASPLRSMVQLIKFIAH